MKKRDSVLIQTATPPIVELDSEARAAYVRFSDRKVAQTRPRTVNECMVTVDYDSDGAPIGVELIGVDEFTVASLLEKAGYTLPEGMSERTRYVPANLQPA